MLGIYLIMRRDFSAYAILITRLSVRKAFELQIVVLRNFRVRVFLKLNHEQVIFINTPLMQNDIRCNGEEIEAVIVGNRLCFALSIFNDVDELLLDRVNFSEAQVPIEFAVNG